MTIRKKWINFAAFMINERMDLSKIYTSQADIIDQQALSMDSNLLQDNPVLISALISLPVPTAILTLDRQFIFGNTAFLNTSGYQEIIETLGKKPGELIGCRYATDGDEGCGSSASCRFCGNQKAIITGLIEGKSEEECTINQQNGLMLHLKITTSVIEIARKQFLLYSMQDITNDKKKALLERIFYHDISNSAHNINSMAELLSENEDPEKTGEYLGMLLRSTGELIDEINTQRLLSGSNQIEYLGEPVTINSFHFYKELKSEFESINNGKITVAFDTRSEHFSFISDKVLLRRVVTNMVKNAIEAEQYQGRVTIGIMSLNEKGAMIWVQNPSFMSDEIQHQIFNRSFSTKGSDRGLGTYSMKILTEKFIKGKISFTSSPTSGTTFIIEIPGH